MSDSRSALTSAARQLLAIEQLLGADYIPAGGNPLPAGDCESAPVREQARAEASPQEKARLLDEIDQQVRQCTLCGLAAGRTNTVSGEGDPNADLVFVGEAPGQEEDLTGRPFVGRAGELLTKMIHAMGLTREQIFICNTLKCRPPNNRAPAPDETTACWPYLVRQLGIIRPKVIVTMGNPATKALLNTKTGITRLRGQWQQLPDIGEDLAGTAVMPTFHPAYVLRQYTVETRRLVWSDLQQVMAALGLSEPSAS